MREYSIQWGDTPLILHAHRAVFLPETLTLIISDLHLGKTGHFRKHGIAVPIDIAKTDLQRLSQLIELYQPTNIVIAGDFFHAQVNCELDLFQEWKTQYELINFILIKGNHDRLKKSIYTELGFELIPNYLSLNNLVITHDYDDRHQVKQISGHVHPGIVLKGISKQRLRVPVFAYNDNHLLLPAFSKFTGLYTQFKVDDYTCVGLTDEEIFTI